MLEGFYPGERRATAVSLSASSVYWGEGALITRGTYAPGQPLFHFQHKQTIKWKSLETIVGGRHAAKTSDTGPHFSARYIKQAA
jgi:hypothetical protein